MLNINLCRTVCVLFIDEVGRETETMKAASELIRFKHGIHLATVQIEPYEIFMLSCKYCKPLLRVNSEVAI